jgi:hypothetical protein
MSREEKAKAEEMQMAIERSLREKDPVMNAADR